MNLERLAAALDLDVYEVGICHACLSFVSFPLDVGDEREEARAVRTFTPILWREGLALPLQAALERARRRGVEGAEEVVDDVERRGAKAPIVAAVVRRLAAELTRRTQEDLIRLGLAPPAGRIIDLPVDGECNTM
jgi:hypothetical protein